MTAIPLHRKPEYLMSGYIREQLVDKYDNDAYPIELNKVILDFAGNVLLRFDTTHEYFKQFIQDDGLTINRKVQTDLDKLDGYTIGSSWGISNGITEIKLKVIEPGESDAIGITSNIDDCKQPIWINLQTGYNYTWYFDTLYELKPKREKTASEASLSEKLGCQWKSGDIVLLKIDCNKWEVAFLLNDERMGSLPIKQDLEYHLMIGSQVYAENSKYQIII